MIIGIIREDFSKYFTTQKEFLQEEFKRPIKTTPHPFKKTIPREYSENNIGTPFIPGTFPKSYQLLCGLDFSFLKRDKVLCVPAF
jgi:hypothetical protein